MCSRAEQYTGTARESCLVASSVSDFKMKRKKIHLPLADTIWNVFDAVNCSSPVGVDV